MIKKIGAEFIVVCDCCLSQQGGFKKFHDVLSFKEENWQVQVSANKVKDVCETCLEEEGA